MWVIRHRYRCCHKPWCQRMWAGRGKWLNQLAYAGPIRCRLVSAGNETTEKRANTNDYQPILTCFHITQAHCDCCQRFCEALSEWIVTITGSISRIIISILIIIINISCKWNYSQLTIRCKVFQWQRITSQSRDRIDRHQLWKFHSQRCELIHVNTWLTLITRCDRQTFRRLD